MDNSGKWPCQCGVNLGNVAFGELQVSKDGCANINTDGVNLVLTCITCGTTKVWFAKAPSIENAFMDTIAKKVGDRVMKQVEKLMRGAR